MLISRGKTHHFLKVFCWSLKTFPFGSDFGNLWFWKKILYFKFNRSNKKLFFYKQISHFKITSNLTSNKSSNLDLSTKKVINNTSTRISNDRNRHNTTASLAWVMVYNNSSFVLQEIISTVQIVLWNYIIVKLCYKIFLND